MHLLRKSQQFQGKQLPAKSSNGKRENESLVCVGRGCRCLPALAPICFSPAALGLVTLVPPCNVGSDAKVTNSLGKSGTRKSPGISCPKQSETAFNVLRKAPPGPSLKIEIELVAEETENRIKLVAEEMGASSQHQRAALVQWDSWDQPRHSAGR